MKSPARARVPASQSSARNPPREEVIKRHQAEYERLQQARRPTWIRTKIDGVRVPIEIDLLISQTKSKSVLYATKGYESFANRKMKVQV
jgi:hypothetical protein